MELPHGRVSGDRSGREHCEHWIRRTIARASAWGSRVRETVNGDCPFPSVIKAADSITSEVDDGQSTAPVSAEPWLCSRLMEEGKQLYPMLLRPSHSTS